MTHIDIDMHMYMYGHTSGALPKDLEYNYQFATVAITMAKWAYYN